MSAVTALPWLGLGLSSNLDASQQPHPYKLLEAEPGLFDFLEYSAPLDVDEARGQCAEIRRPRGLGRQAQTAG